MLNVQKIKELFCSKGILTAVFSLALLLVTAHADAASLKLSWVNNSTVTGHVIEIERCIVVAPATTCTNFVKINQVTYPAATYTDSTLGEATKARYQVRASAAGTVSTYSNQGENTTGINAPTGLTVDNQ